MSNNSNTIVLETEEVIIPKTSLVRKVMLTDRISISETTGSVQLNGQSYGMEAVIHILDNKELLLKAFKQVRIKKALEAAGVSSASELLEYLKGE